MAEKSKRKINAKKFLEDFRAGKDDSVLMSEYGLTRSSLDKLLAKLVDRGHLDSTEVTQRQSSSFNELPDEEADSEALAPHNDDSPQAYSGFVEHESSREVCPQCGAEVSEKALTCPECGHVLPGEERWSQVEPDLKLTERIPPAVIGTIFAIPVGIALFIFFWYFVLPAQETRVNKQIDRLMKETNNKAPMEAAQSQASAANLRVVELVYQRLLVQEVFANASEDYSSLTIGEAWNTSTNQQRVVWINMIGRAMVRAGLPAEFEIVDQSGKQLSYVTESSIEFFQEGGFKEFYDPNFSSR
jgi:hypothetical protein